MKEITLIGLKELKDVLRRDREKVSYGITPPPRIILLDHGNGRSAVAEFAGDLYAGSFQPEEQVRYVELRLDGTKDNFKRELNKLELASVFSNHYQGVIAVEASGLAAYRESKDYEEFLTVLNEISKYGAVLLFFSENPSKDEQVLMKELFHIEPDNETDKSDMTAAGKEKSPYTDFPFLRGNQEQ